MQIKLYFGVYKVMRQIEILVSRVLQVQGK